MSFSKPSETHDIARIILLGNYERYISPRILAFREIAALTESSRNEWYSDVFNELADSARNKPDVISSQIREAASEHMYEFETHFISTQRTGLIFAIYGFVESHLYELCAWTREWMELRIACKDLSGNGVERTKNFFLKCANCDSPLINGYFDDFIRLSKLRNVLIHSHRGLPLGHPSVNALRESAVHFGSAFDISEKREIILTNLTANLFIDKGEALINALHEEIPERLEATHLQNISSKIL